VTSDVVLVVVLSCLSGQFAACGPCPPLFAHVVVVVVVVSAVIPPFTGSVVVVVSLVSLGAGLRPQEPAKELL
jgi:integral membrane sensor domain MASE1